MEQDNIVVCIFFTVNCQPLTIKIAFARGSSSVGRASRSQREGRRFDPALLQRIALVDLLVGGS